MLNRDEVGVTPRQDAEQPANVFNLEEPPLGVLERSVINDKVGVKIWGRFATVAVLQD